MSVEFEPVGLRPRRRRIDPVAIGLVVVVVALSLAVLKPWGDGSPRILPAPSSGPTDSPVPTPTRVAPAIISPRRLTPPTWVEIASVSAKRRDWGIRTIVLRAGNISSDGMSSSWEERWVSAGGEAGPDGASLIVDAGGGSIVALGLTFPPAETPLAARIWLRHEREWEWIDARPVDKVPGRGAYLFLWREATQSTSTRFWEPGHYRVDVLIASGIRRIEIDVVGRSGVVPDPGPWAREPPRSVRPIASDMDGLPVGLYAQADGATVSLASAAGSALDETGAWLDLDRRATDDATRSFVARVYLPGTIRLGVKLPPMSAIRTAFLRRLAPSNESAPIGAGMTTASGESFSFVSFGPPDGGPGATWSPGVYALTVDWEDVEGPHRWTWHAELRPGPVQVEPVLLSATRAWARHAGSSGILMATSETWSLREAFDGSNTIGCGKDGVRGRPTVVGFAGPVGTDLSPVAARILYPFADVGPLPVLTAAGAVPGLALVAPFLTADFGGPAAYGFRAGSGTDAPGYTVCIGLVSPAG